MLGFAIAVGLIAIPAVQGWLLRSALRTQAGARLEFSDVRVGPTGASARELRLQLPNFAVEARALRLALSPWQLLTRRRLALDSVEARELQLTSRSTSEPAAPFTGVLDSLKAPLDWAVTQADAEGRFIVEQAGAAPLIATFQLRGSDLQADQPGEMELTLSAPGDLLPGWQGRWSFTGKIAYRPAADGNLDAITLSGAITPASHADLAAPPLHLTLTVTRTAAGENYEVQLVGADAAWPSLEGDLRASFTRSDGMTRGNWTFEAGEQLVARFLRRANLPDLTFRGSGTLSVDSRFEAISALGEVALRGSHWDRLAPQLAQLGAAAGKNSFELKRHEGRWELASFALDLGVTGSDARLRFHSLQSQPLVPFRAGDTEWAELNVSGIPLEWAKPFLPGVTLAGGAISGSWRASTPSDTELRLTPSRPVETGRFTVAHAALPAAQPLELSLHPSIKLTPDAAQLELKSLRFAFDGGDYVAIDATSTVDFTHLTAQLAIAWNAELPSLLAGPDKPLPFAFTGRIEAKADERAIDLTDAQLEARTALKSDPVFLATLLSPVRYQLADGKLEASNDFARIRAQNLPLAWLSRFQPDFTLAGEIERGESTLGLRDQSLTLATSTPWTLAAFSLAQKEEQLLRDVRLALQPSGTLAWPIEKTPRGALELKLAATVPEAAKIIDPTGPFDATAEVRVSTRDEGPCLDFALVTLKRGNGDALVELRTAQAMIFKADAPTSGDFPIWFNLRTGRLPLELFRAHLAPRQEVEGEIEPAEFVARGDWPTFNLRTTAPLQAQIRRFVSDGKLWLENVSFTAEPGVQNTKLLHSVFVENVRGLPSGAAQLGSLGSGFLMFLGDNFAMPVAAEFRAQLDLRQWQQQPLANVFSLPASGLITTGYEHDLFNDKRPSFNFALEHVAGAEGQPPIAPLKASLKLASLGALAADEIGAQVEVELGTQPRPSKVAFEVVLNNRDKLVNVNSTMKGEFFDLSELERLVATTERKRAPAPQFSEPEDSTSAKVQSAAEPKPTERSLTQALIEQSHLEFPFWLVIRGRFDLQLQELARAPYRITDVKGALELGANNLTVRDLAGRTFEGAWSGGLQVDFQPQDATAPYRLGGEFRIDRLDAASIIKSVYPEEPPMFTGRLSLATAVSSRGLHLAGLLRNSAAKFDFRADDGRLSVKVPHASLASTALVFGGAVTLSPELRALGRLITKFDGMPVSTLRASGRREPNGLVALDEFRVETPQLRLAASGEWRLRPGTPWPTAPFEVPVRLSARDEIAVILKGMRLLEKKPDADGFFPLSRTPKVKGTPGQPDTSELFDMLAHAADKSSGTFGFLMRKLQKEVAKSQATGKPAAKSPTD